MKTTPTAMRVLGAMTLLGSCPPGGLGGLPLRSPIQRAWDRPSRSLAASRGHTVRDRVDGRVVCTERRTAEIRGDVFMSLQNYPGAVGKESAVCEKWACMRIYDAGIRDKGSCTLHTVSVTLQMIHGAWATITTSPYHQPSR